MNTCGEKEVCLLFTESSNGISSQLVSYFFFRCGGLLVTHPSSVAEVYRVRFRHRLPRFLSAIQLTYSGKQNDSSKDR